ncbi:hypothetical protein [Streptomyces sp. NPDC004546]|uniref:hypothetical protein n=1 Tax=unclassified Streptomyces TaxID=2593676 RepID=UPI0033A17F1F
MAATRLAEAMADLDGAGRVGAAQAPLAQATLYADRRRSCGQSAATPKHMPC